MRHAPRPAPRPSRFDPYVGFVRETLARYPRLTATRIWHMLRERGCPLSVRQVREQVAELRPSRREAYPASRRTFPAEEGQVDWASFGHVMIGAARRALSAFVLTLTFSRWFFLRFFLDQSLENFLRGHVYAFEDLQGCPRYCLYDNLRSAVARAPRGGRALQSPPARARLPLSLRPPGLSARTREREGRGGADRTLRARFVLRRALLHDPRGPQPPGARVAGRGGGGAPLARRRSQDGRRGLRRGSRAASDAARSPLRDRSRRPRPLREDHLHPLRPQRLLDPSHRGRPSAHPRRFRDHGPYPRGTRTRSPGTAAATTATSGSRTPPTSRRFWPRSDGRAARRLEPG